MSKNKLQLYYTLEDKPTMFRIKPEQHNNLHKFLTTHWTDVTTQYEAILDADKLKGRVVGLRFDEKNFSILQRELHTRASSITIWRTTRQPIATLRVGKPTVVEVEKKEHTKPVIEEKPPMKLIVKDK